MARINNKFVKWADWKLKNAIHLDGYEDEEGNSHSLDLPAPDISNPLLEILNREEQLEYEELLINSYSEAKAYLITFGHFRLDKESVSHYFCITTDTLDRRVNRAILVLKRQPSLFDSIEILDETFMPNSGIARLRMATQQIKEQMGFEFA